MDEYAAYNYIELLMISLYLVFVFLSVQIYFIWIDVDKKELRSKISDDESILKNSIIIVFFIGVFFIIHEFVEGTNPSYLLFELFELSGFICVLLFIYNWYLTLKTCAHKKKPASDFLIDACMNGMIKVEAHPSFPGINRMMISRLLSVFCIASVILALVVPVSANYFLIILGLLFVPPALALVSTLFGGFLISREIGHRQVATNKFSH